MKRYFFGAFVLVMVWWGCQKDEDTPRDLPDNNLPTDTIPDDTASTDTIPPVDAYLQDLPYDSLSSYNFFIGEDLSDLIPNEGLLRYEPISQLFTDYAKKSRYVYMPEGSSASYDSDTTTFNFPDGTILIKNFYYDNIVGSNSRRVMETRLIFKRNGEWEFADYVWNAAQDEALFDLSGSNHPIDIVKADGSNLSVNYRIPSAQECLTCHKESEKAWPIGPKPQNLNSDLAYQDGIMNQLMKWTESGYLLPTYPQNIETVVDWEDEAAGLKDRVRAYFDANCGHCHKDNSHCSYRNIRLAYSESVVEENMGVCVPADDFLLDQPFLEYIIDGGSPETSIMWYRLNSTETDVKMPLLGTSVVHEEGVNLITQYINSLDTICP
jgi:uncharacterized repeat protein (TIGR03806 family)